MRRSFPACAALAGWLIVLASGTAHAVAEDIHTSPFPIEAVMSSDGRHVAWGRGEVSVRDRSSATTESYLLGELAGVAPATALRLFAISDDGRYLTYSVSAGGTYGYTTMLQFDRATRVPRVLFDNRSASGVGPSNPQVVGVVPAVSVSRDGRTLAWIRILESPTLAAQVVALVDADTVPRVIGTTCLIPGSLYPSLCTQVPAVSGDGRTILYAAGDNSSAALAYYDVSSGTRTYYPQVQPQYLSNLLAGPSIIPTVDASFVVARRQLGGSVLFDRARGRVELIGAAPLTTGPVALSDDGVLVLLSASPGLYESALLDRRTGLQARLAGHTRALAMTADGAAVLAVERDDDAQVFRLQIRALDADQDGMLDMWESTFGLDPTSAADAGLDANGDGVTNLQTFLERGHPGAVAAHSRYFAEGAAGTFFDTVVSLFNPGPASATIVTRLQGAVAGETATRISVLAAGERADVASCCLSMATPAEFAIAVASDAPIVAERRMTWDRASGYGSHASAAADAPANAWYFAEGATIAGFQTFLLLQNPGDMPATADVDFLLPAGGAVRRAYTVPASGRLTVWVNQEGAPLAQAEFAMRVTASLPIVAERAMYRDVAGQVFGAGSNAMGATAPATAWSFAEGATGPFFDTFLLVANTAPTSGTVTATYTAETAGGPQTVTRTYPIAGDSRLTIWLDQEDPALADAAVSSVLTADVPIVAERAMWWPGSAATWAESHVELGATARGTRWAIADAELNALVGVDTFVLVDADTGGTPASAAVTAYPSQGFPVPRVVALTHGRNTLWMAQLFPELTGQRFSLIVESLDRPGGAATLTVEKAIYSRSFAAGAAARATRLP